MQIPVWLAHFSSDMPAGALDLRDGAAHQLLALAREVELKLALSVSDDNLLEVTILPETPAAAASMRLTAQQHLNHWMQILDSDATGPARRQAEKEVGYWRREVRAEHRRLNKK